MEDREVITAFVEEGAKRAFGPSLHVEGDCMFLDGWWHTAFRIAPDTFMLRTEEPPAPTDALVEVAGALARRGFHHVADDLTPMVAITYAELSLGTVGWALWAPDLPTGERALAARAGTDTFLTNASSGPLWDPPAALGPELGGARKLAGLPPAVVLSMGLGPEEVGQLRAALPDCRLEAKELGQIEPEDCGALLPTLVLVDATGDAGREFIMRFRANACGRFLPVLAVARDDVPLGADERVDPDAPPAAWAEVIGRLLP